MKEDNYIIQDFIVNTPIWYDNLYDDIKKDRGGCQLCGVFPKNLLDLSKVLAHKKEIKEKLKKNLMVNKSVPIDEYATGYYDGFNMYDKNIRKLIDEL